MPNRQHNAICPGCHGPGRVVIYRMAIANGRAGTAGVEERCKDCEGKGYVTFEVEATEPAPEDR